MNESTGTGQAVTTGLDDTAVGEATVDAAATDTTLRTLVDDILDLERIEENIFRGRSPDDGMQRVFGGQVAAQAMVAASRTVSTDRSIHSLHSYFLRPGDPTIPIVYEVDRLRDGRSFATRRVVAIQHGKAIFVLSASYQVEEEGFDHQAAMPEVRPADELVSYSLLHEGAKSPLTGADSPFDVRYDGDPRGYGGPGLGTNMWIRTSSSLPDDPLLHQTILVYASDIALLRAVVNASGRPNELLTQQQYANVASLDHAVWFHRPCRMDEWMLYAQESPSSSGARGLATGSFFTADGVLAASVVQEGLFRRRR
ncbi:MAG: acyl-CoA thioesterase II [Actinomycetota bacterium]|nr:MAG: acyl-CoA thioesterase II [Actinomycetota bacterium]